MSDGPDNLVLAFLRPLDAKFDAMAAGLSDLKSRVTLLERQFGHFVASDQAHYGTVMERFDRIERRLDRVERAADLFRGEGVALPP